MKKSTALLVAVVFTLLWTCVLVFFPGLVSIIGVICTGILAISCAPLTIIAYLIYGKAAFISGFMAVSAVVGIVSVATAAVKSLWSTIKIAIS